jgi:integrase/recombinase XerD
MALLKQPNPKAPTGLRNLCLISLMLKTGMRVSEIINLQTDDIDWENRHIYIRASGAARSRVLELDSSELSLLRSWSIIRPIKDHWFFCTLTGSKLKDRYIREMIKRLARKAGIDKDVYPHLLRYSFAVDFIRDTSNIKLLQDALGHRDPAATQIYTRLLFHNRERVSDQPAGINRSGMPVRPASLPDSNQNEKPDQLQSSLTNLGQIMETRLDGEGICITGTTKMAQKGSDLLKGQTEEIKQPVAQESKADPAALDQVSQEKEAEIQIEIDLNKPVQRKRIPALKCSGCSFILHYEGDCPHCGTSFNEIIKHWRKNV